MQKRAQQRQKIKIKMNQQATKTQMKAQTEETNKKRPPHNTLLTRLRKKGSPISDGIQPRHEDKGKDNGCDTQRKKNKGGGMRDSNQMKKKNEVYRHEKHRDGLTAQK